jgi:hypothetical protein
VSWNIDWTGLVSLTSVVICHLVLSYKAISTPTPLHPFISHLLSPEKPADGQTDKIRECSVPWCLKFPSGGSSNNWLLLTAASMSPLQHSTPCADRPHRTNENKWSKQTGKGTRRSWKDAKNIVTNRDKESDQNTLRWVELVTDTNLSKEEKEKKN